MRQRQTDFTQGHAVDSVYVDRTACSGSAGCAVDVARAATSAPVGDTRRTGKVTAGLRPDLRRDRQGGNG